MNPHFIATEDETRPIKKRRFDDDIENTLEDERRRIRDYQAMIMNAIRQREEAYQYKEECST